MKKETTIYDIAKELNISPATVSRAINGHPAINLKTKEKVQKTADALGYQSNRFASNLRKQKSNTLGVIIHRLNSYVASSILAGMEKVANEAGYNLIISQSLESSEKEIQNANTMLMSRVDGLLMAFAFDTEKTDHILPFLKRKIPVVFFDRVIDHPDCTKIVIDNYKDGYWATKHLLEQGCKRLLHVTGSLKRNVYQDRLMGFESALREAKIELESDMVLTTGVDENAPQIVLEHIQSMDKKPDGIFFANDSTAAGTMPLLKKAGYKIPEDIAIVGFNNEPISRIVEPNLTTVHYPAVEMGEMAAQTIIGHLNGLQQGSTIMLRSELIERASSLRKSL